VRLQLIAHQTKGVQGVQHLASDVSFGTDYEGIIKATKEMTATFLNTACKHESVISVVLTSSRIAAYNPEYGKDIHVTKNDWADYFVDLAKNTKSDDPLAPILICQFPSHKRLRQCQGPWLTLIRRS
jgi:hypothetical protein